LRAAEIQSQLGETYFAWSGPTDPGSAIYFRVTGPSLVIEYGAQGSGPPTHIHGIYRDPTNDYGSRYTRCLESAALCRPARARDQCDPSSTAGTPISRRSRFIQPRQSVTGIGRANRYP